MEDCLFCQIAAGTTPARVIHADDRVLAFHDIKPQAPLHALVVPREHIETLDALTPGTAAIMGEMFTRAAAIARDYGYGDRGYRTVVNCRADAGQTVYHIHLHLLAGRRFTWPPG